MEKRLVIAVILSIGVLMAWSKLFPTAPAPAPAVSSGQTPSIPSSSPSEAPSGASAPGQPAGQENQPEQKVELRTHDVRFVFSSLGGTLRSAQLLDPKYRAHPNDVDSGRDLVTVQDASQAALRTTFPGATFPALAGSWQVSRPAPDTVSFVAENADVRVEKRYRTDTTRYRVQLDVVVQNKTDKEQDHHLALHIAGHQDQQKKGGGFFSGGAANLSSMLCYLNGDRNPEREPIEKLAKNPIDKLGNVLWIGSDEKFFLLAAIPYPELTPSDRRCLATTNDGQVGEGVLTFSERAIPARGSTSYAFSIYAGPKVISDLEAVQPGGLNVELDKAVDVTLAILSRPILVLLKFFHGFARNWGLAIILLTLFIKLLTFYPTQKSMLSAKKMQKLAPKMAAIKKKYENDKQRQSQETMNLYKANGVSPFGGCLPSLIQMPIWIALYSTLNYAVELYRAPFILYIHDLTDKDPYYITPLLMGGVMFLQMRMSPASPDNEQQKTMQFMMPIMFTAFSLVLPSGLALYMLTSYLIGIVQQLYINHVDRKTSAA
jgi:YidC/Oxa1 family membrane protein insertase